jgi:hypothetical protein
MLKGMAEVLLGNGLGFVRSGIFGYFEILASSLVLARETFEDRC